MDYFSPNCPKCRRNDELEIDIDRNFDIKYRCKRCNLIFKVEEGYPKFTTSIYLPTEGSVSSGSFIKPSSS